MYSLERKFLQDYIWMKYPLLKILKFWVQKLRTLSTNAVHPQTLRMASFMYLNRAGFVECGMKNNWVKGKLELNRLSRQKMQTEEPIAHSFPKALLMLDLHLNTLFWVTLEIKWSQRQSVWEIGGQFYSRAACGGHGQWQCRIRAHIHVCHGVDLQLLAFLVI